MPRMGGNMDDEIIFASGRKMYCHTGVIGLQIEGNRHPLPQYGADGALDDLHPDDARELADAMIEAWTRYKLSQPQ